jgi:hypothetical protein
MRDAKEVNHGLQQARTGNRDQTSNRPIEHFECTQAQ